MPRARSTAMGEVWVAKQTELVNRRVALKLIKTGTDSRAVLQRFEQASLIQLYEATAKPDKAARFRQELEARNAAGKPQPKSRNPASTRECRCEVAQALRGLMDSATGHRTLARGRLGNPTGAGRLHGSRSHRDSPMAQNSPAPVPCDPRHLAPAPNGRNGRRLRTRQQQPNDHDLSERKPRRRGLPGREAPVGVATWPRISWAAGRQPSIPSINERTLNHTFRLMDQSEGFS